jgi:CBS domain containing-hemolysin-like protein
MRDFQREHLHIAIVVNEYGDALGVVTLEDVVEEIIGEVRDEFDVDEPPVRRLEDGSLLVRGEVLLREVERELGLALHADGADTIEAYLLRLRPTGLAKGEEVEVAGRARFRVERGAGRRIWMVRAARVEGSP